MSTNIIDRGYLTFSELMSKWQCAENDLRYAIITSELKPSIRLIGMHACLTWDIDPWGDWEASEVNDGFRRDMRKPRGWQYLQDPIQTGPFDCQFEHASDERDPDKSDIPFAWWHQLKTTMTLDDVLTKVVFVDEEIKRYESEHGISGSNLVAEIVEKPLRESERQVLLKIIAVLAKLAKLDIYKDPGKSALYVHSMSDSMGISVSKRAVDGHIKAIKNTLENRMK